MIELNFDTEHINRELKRLEGFPHVVQQALFPAVANTMDILRDEIAERLLDTVPLPKQIIKSGVKVINPRISGDGVEASIRVASFKPIPLIEYDVQPMEVTARKGLRSRQWPGFTYALRKGKRRDRTRLIRSWHSLPFIAQVRNSTGKRRDGSIHSAQPGAGHLGVYGITSYGQLKQLYGPRLQYHAATPEMEVAFYRNAEITLHRILKGIVDRILE